MKIGIITYWTSTDNYGQLLQCFALQKHLRDHGHEAFLIKYSGKTQHTSSIKASKIKDYITHFGAYARYARDLWNRRRYQAADQTPRYFDVFLKENVASTKKTYTYDTLLADPPYADAYICGSDQIWGSNDDIYYLSFARGSSLKIAYAPSFGGVSCFTLSESAEIARLLKDFRLITTREKSGVDTLAAVGIGNARQVVDPTLLLSAADYEPLCDRESVTNDVFVYLLGNPIVCKTKEIFRFIKAKGWKYTYVASQGRVDKFTKTPATIPQWLSGIKQSKLVITNSFHCVVFSLLFSRPFIFIPLSGEYARMNNRIEELLSACGLETQIYNGDFNKVPTEISLDSFRQTHRQQREFSQQLLHHAINND